MQLGHKKLSQLRGNHDQIQTRTKWSHSHLSESTVHPDKHFAGQDKKGKEENKRRVFIIDTPGQIEVFNWSASGLLLV